MLLDAAGNVVEIRHSAAQPTGRRVVGLAGGVWSPAEACLELADTGPVLEAITGLVTSLVGLT